MRKYVWILTYHLNFELRLGIQPYIHTEYTSRSWRNTADVFCVCFVFVVFSCIWSSRKFSQTYIRCIVTSSRSPKERKNKQNNNPLHPLPPTRPPRIVGMYVCICVVRDFPSSLRHLLERARHRTLLPVQGYTLLSCCRHRRCFFEGVKLVSYAWKVSACTV